MNDIVNAVQTIGLPAAMVLLEAWYIKYQRDSHSSETKEFIDALRQNTTVLIELKERLQRGS